MEQEIGLRPEKVIAHYIEAYQKLYNRSPRELQILDNEWVIVNGARMRVSELAYLTAQLQHEYKQNATEERRSIVKRLVKWFKGI